MARYTAFFLCLFAALFLVPVQVEGVEILEYEADAEVECVVSGNVLSEASVSAVKLSAVKKDAVKYLYAGNRSVARYHPVNPVLPPARIRLCVFRE